MWNSNHRSGTALDLNWSDHPFHQSYAGFDKPKIDVMRALLDFYTVDGLPLIYWGEDWGQQGIGPFDPMHVQANCGTFNSPKLDKFIQERIRSDGLSTYKRGKLLDTAVLAAAKVPSVTEKVLPFDHSQQVVAQEKFFDCCPASVQIVMNGLGVQMSEDDLIRAIGTTTEGTNTVEQALPILNEKVGAGGKWVAQWLPNDPPRQDQIDALWANVKNSVDAGHGCVVNFELSSAHFPVATRGTISPQWRGAKVWHYLACMGYADDGPGGKHLLIVDPGFGPFDKGGFFMSLEAVANAIVPHAYAHFVPNTPAVPVAAKPPIQQQPAPTAVLAASVTPTPSSVCDMGEFWAEWSAIEVGDLDSIVHVLRTAAGKGDTTPEVVHRARAVLARIPRAALSGALASLERTEPDVLTALTGRIA